MFKRIKAMKDLLWAFGIFLTLAFLSVGLIIMLFTSYHGEKGWPVMDLRGEAEQEDDEDDSAESKKSESKDGLTSDGTLHPLALTADAGEAYPDKLTFLCDSAFSGLRGAGLCLAPVWSSDSGKLPMDEADAWTILYPADGSEISPAQAAMIAKPPILVIAIGCDGIDGIGKKDFISAYETLIRDIHSNSPETRIVCLSLCSIALSHIDSEGLTHEKVMEIDGWIKTVCIDTGAYYGNVADALCNTGYMRSEFADGSGRALNRAGLEELLNYLRLHSLDTQ